MHKWDNIRRKEASRLSELHSEVNPATLVPSPGEPAEGAGRMLPYLNDDRNH